jgi:hypothetical protein
MTGRPAADRPAVHTIDESLAAIGESDAADVYRPFWDESLASYPVECGHLLDPAVVEASARIAGCDESTVAALLRVVERVRRSPVHAFLLWHQFRLVFGKTREEYPLPAFTAAAPPQFPLFERSLGTDGGIVHLLTVLGYVPAARAEYARRGISEAVVRDTLFDIGLAVTRYARRHGGRLGIMPVTLQWFRVRAQCRYFRLGRLQFEITPASPEVRVFRDGVSGATAALDARADSGVAAGTGRNEAPDAIRGCFVFPDGRSTTVPVALDAPRWAPVYGPGDTVIAVHIPEGDPMTVARCRDSLRRALQFFPRHFPEAPFRAFQCRSWILNPEIAAIYREDMNIVRFQREGYLYPIASDGAPPTLFFLFDRVNVRCEDASLHAGLKRAVLEHLRSGGALRVGGWCLLVEDAGRFGTRPYLDATLPAAVEQDHGEVLSRYGVARSRPSVGAIVAQSGET